MFSGVKEKEKWHEMGQFILQTTFWKYSQTYLGPCKMSMLDLLFAKILNSFQLFTIFAKNLIVYV